MNGDRSHSLAASLDQFAVTLDQFAEECVMAIVEDFVNLIFITAILILIVLMAWVFGNFLWFTLFPNTYEEHIEIISCIPDAAGSIYIGTADGRSFWVPRPDSLQILAVADRFPVRCSALISNTPTSQRATHFQDITPGVAP